MRELLRRSVGASEIVIGYTTRDDGDLSPATVHPTELEVRRRELLDMPWQALRQVHSDRVVTTRVASAERPIGDALVTDSPGVALAIHVGDCVPVGFVSADGWVGGAHAGWKGLEAGVLESTVRAMGSRDVEAVVGPHIRVDQYEFGEADLARLAVRFGDEVIGRTHDGTPALDLTQAISRELERLGVPIVAVSDDCTATDAANYWSYRARQEAGRIAMLCWIEAA